MGWIAARGGRPARTVDAPDRASWAPAPGTAVPAHRGRAPEDEGAAALAWLRLALGSLMLAGLLALVLVVGRMPVLKDLITDPLFAKRCLVVHVNLALGVWLLAFLAALAGLLPGRAAGRLRLLAGARPARLAAAGILLSLVPAGIPGVAPVLSNYVPALDHPLFLAGLALFAGAVAAGFLPRLARSVAGARAETAADPGGLPAGAAAGIKAAMVIFLAAMVTLWASALGTPRGYAPAEYYELLFWGPGHLLQFVHAAGMASCWILLVTEATGRAPVSGRVAGGLFALLAAPALLGPTLAAGGTHTPAYHTGFTLIMRWGTWPAILALLLLCLRHLARSPAAPGRRRGPYLAGFHASWILTVAGFILGALIRGPTTLVPAHYHAAVGGVTAAYMAAAFLLAARLGLPRPAGRSGRLLPLQPALYGAGQLLFALGFGFAGLHGAARKTYGSEQIARSLPEQAGLAVMGLGGLVAVAGGLLFLWLLGRTLSGARRAGGDGEDG